MAPTSKMRTALLAVVVVACGLLLAGCPRECRISEHCARTCECQDLESDRIVACEVFFTCDAETRQCDLAAQAKTCDEICQEFAAPLNDQGDNLCGRRRCTNDRDCDRELICSFQSTGPNGQPTTTQFECVRNTFRCEIDLGFCEAAASAPDAQLCQQCPLPGTQ